MYEHFLSKVIFLINKVFNDGKENHQKQHDKYAFSIHLKRSRFSKLKPFRTLVPFELILSKCIIVSGFLPLTPSLGGSKRAQTPRKYSDLFNSHRSLKASQLLKYVVSPLLSLKNQRVYVPPIPVKIEDILNNSFILFIFHTNISTKDRKDNKHEMAIRTNVTSNMEPIKLK